MKISGIWSRIPWKLARTYQSRGRSRCLQARSVQEEVTLPWLPWRWRQQVHWNISNCVL